MSWDERPRTEGEDFGWVLGRDIIYAFGRGDDNDATEYAPVEYGRFFHDPQMNPPGT
jgi:hypothetical protein